MKNFFYVLLVVTFQSYVHAQVSDFKSIDFSKADMIAKLNIGATLDNLPVLAYKLTHDLSTDVEKFRAIYSWVCNNIKGDNAQHNIVRKKRKKLENDSIAFMQWNREYKKKAFSKLVRQKKTMCTGYAYLIKELCFLSKIECKIVDGYGRTIDTNVDRLEIENHSWNAVKLNEKWYLCDATWSSGYMGDYNIFVQEYNEGYFLTDPILFGKNHLPSNPEWSLNQELTDSVFVKAPLVYGETFKQKIIPVYPASFKTKINKNDEILFSFSTTDLTFDKNVSLIYFLGNEEIALKIYDLKKENHKVSFRCRFKNRGTYDAHLRINNDIVSTYVIQVTKT